VNLIAGRHVAAIVAIEVKRSATVHDGAWASRRPDGVPASLVGP